MQLVEISKEIIEKYRIHVDLKIKACLVDVLNRVRTG